MGDRGVKDFEGRVFTEKFITDGLDEMGFAETRSAIEEEGIVASAWTINNTASGGNRKIVIRTDDEIIEGIFLVEAGVAITGG